MKKAFTLVELLVVMAIMAILTVVVVSQFRTAKRRANDVARKGDLNSVAKALQMYFADYGEMPGMDSSSGGQIKVGAEVMPWGGEFRDGTGYVYMKILPREKTVNWPQFCYKTDVGKKKYALFAKLEITSDSQCEGNNYSCGGKSGYCFAFASPNTSLTSNGDLN